MSLCVRIFYFIVILIVLLLGIYPISNMYSIYMLWQISFVIKFSYFFLANISGLICASLGFCCIIDIIWLNCWFISSCIDVMLILSSFIFKHHFHGILIIQIYWECTSRAEIHSWVYWFRTSFAYYILKFVFFNAWLSFPSFNAIRALSTSLPDKCI